MDIVSFFAHSTPLFLCFVFFISLVIGSFLNVVILRFPPVLFQEWQRQCYEFLDSKMAEVDKPVIAHKKDDISSALLNRSHCLHCKKPIRFYDNVPLISFFVLRGKCRQCHKPISWQYPIIEALAAMMATIVAYNFGVTWQTLAGCLFSYVLLVQATIDLQHTIIPDEITLPMVWIGLLLSIPLIFVDSKTAILGAVSGYLILWIIYWGFFIMTRKEGMGYGDFKLLAMLGAWLGWQMLPFIILCSSVLGSIVGLTMLVRHGKKSRKRIPFGPYLGFAGWIALIYGQAINDWYWQFAGIY